MFHFIHEPAAFTRRFDIRERASSGKELSEMLVKKSRYRNAEPFQPFNDGIKQFSGLRLREIGPATGVIEHELQAGDRLDHLARNYYNDDRLWWRIADANPDFLFAPDMLAGEMAGSVILIPKVKE